MTNIEVLDVSSTSPSLGGTKVNAGQFRGDERSNGSGV